MEVGTLIFKYKRMVDVCKKGDRGTSSFLLLQHCTKESLLVITLLFQLVCLAISSKLDDLEAFELSTYILFIFSEGSCTPRG